MSYFHKAKLLSNYTNRIDLSEHDNGLFEGELLIGKNGDISIADPIVTLLLGYKNRNLNGTPIHIIIPSLNQEKWADFYNKLHKTEAPDEHIYDFIAKKPNGKEMKIQLQPKCFTGANTSFIQFIFRDICKYSNKNYVALEYLAKYDEVSKTLNKLGIMEYLSNEINISNNASFISVMILHIENFSVISNSLGKKACDLILRSFASRIIKCIGKETAIGRIDTADFLLITNDVNNSNKLQNRIHKVIKVAKNAIHTSGISVELSLRVGLANYPEHGESADELIMNARLALAIAKQKTLALYNKYVNKNNTKSSIKVIEIHKAIKENQFKVHYQPIINLKDYSVSSVEALLRWEHPERGVLFPDQFISYIERSKLVRPVTKWVINRALSDARLWKEHSLNLNISINISERNLLDAHFPKLIAECITRNKMRPENLELEISEKNLQAVSEQAIVLLNRLKKCGVNFSMDNFGIGNTSLLHLRKLPFKKIKIHKSLICNIIKSEQDKTTVDATIRLAHGFGIAVIAEAVETELHLKKLKQLGCDYCQGHLFSTPVSSQRLIELFKDWKETFNNDAKIASSNKSIIYAKVSPSVKHQVLH